jgi:hypothetical protein
MANRPRSACEADEWDARSGMSSSLRICARGWIAECGADTAVWGRCVMAEGRGRRHSPFISHRVWANTSFLRLAWHKRCVSAYARASRIILLPLSLRQVNRTTRAWLTRAFCSLIPSFVHSGLSSLAFCTSKTVYCSLPALQNHCMHLPSWEKTACETSESSRLLTA